MLASRLFSVLAAFSLCFSPIGAVPVKPEIRDVSINVNVTIGSGNTVTGILTEVKSEVQSILKEVGMHTDATRQLDLER